MANNKRLLKELADVNTSPPPGCLIKPKDDDIHLWEVIMDGPSDSPYSGGKFTLHITIPDNYPFKPQVLSFKTKIYHPNVSNDDRGAMCLGMLRPEEWKPPNKISDVLKLVRTVLGQPQPDDAVEAAIADQYKKDPNAFAKTARDWTKRYAS